MARTVHEVEIDGQRMKLSNLEKVLYPEGGFTKGQVIDYYRRIAPVILPHLHDRPLTMKRYPEGVEGEFFYEKQCPKHRPEWMDTADVTTSSKVISFCIANDVPSLVWLANMASIEIHPLLARRDRIDRPTKLTFDLDPGPPADIVTCARVALLLREVFDQLGLAAFPKTSGSKGMQIEVPLNSDVTYDDTKRFALAIARLLEARHEDLVVSKMEKVLRPGKVLIDWSQNDESKTTVAVYALRAKSRPTVSTPVTWSEVADCAEGKSLSFTTEEVLTRVESMGDLQAPVITLRQELPKLG